MFEVKRYDGGYPNLELIIMIAGSLFILLCGLTSGNPVIFAVFILAVIYAVYKFKKQKPGVYELNSQGLNIINTTTDTKLSIPYGEIKGVSVMEKSFGRRSRGYNIVIKYGSVLRDISNSASTSIIFVGAKKNECFDFLNVLGERIGKEKIIDINELLSRN